MATEQCFRFLDLPLELQRLIFQHYYDSWCVQIHDHYVNKATINELQQLFISEDSKEPSISPLLVSRRVHDAATYALHRCSSGTLHARTTPLIMLPERILKSTYPQIMLQQTRELHVHKHQWHALPEKQLIALQLAFPRLEVLHLYSQFAFESTSSNYDERFLNNMDEICFDTSEQHLCNWMSRKLSPYTEDMTPWFDAVENGLQVFFSTVTTLRDRNPLGRTWVSKSAVMHFVHLELTRL